MASTEYRRQRHEADVSTQRDPAQAHARLSCPHGDAERAQGAGPAARQGTRTPYALTLPGKPPPRGFPRSARLTRAAEYRRVFQGAERFADRYFTLLAAPNGPEPRLGLAISRRVAPRAVDRNRLKRLLRETFREQRERLPAVDVVAMARPAARHADSRELTAALQRLWRRMAQRCDDS